MKKIIITEAKFNSPCSKCHKRAEFKIKMPKYGKADVCRDCFAFILENFYRRWQKNDK